MWTKHLKTLAHHVYYVRWEELVFSDNGGTSFPVIGKGTGF